MKAVIQRVSSAKVTTGRELLARIGKGLVILLGVAEEDGEKDKDYVADKVANLRIFDDHNGKLNLSIKNIAGEILVVSQFTLLADCRKGRRPSFAKAAQPDRANQLYKEFIEKLEESGLSVKEGRFQAKMSLELINDGPVTILLDSSKDF